MRLIDADALKDNFPNARADIFENCRNCTCLDNEQINRIIDSAPTVNGWISVKDRLPELEEEVLVYASGKIDGFFGKNVTEICNRYVQRIFPSSPGHECWSSPWQYFHTDYEITHWMPLSEPPKTEK